MTLRNRWFFCFFAFSLLFLSQNFAEFAQASQFGTQLHLAEDTPLRNLVCRALAQGYGSVVVSMDPPAVSTFEAQESAIPRQIPVTVGLSSDLPSSVWKNSREKARFEQILCRFATYERIKNQEEFGHVIQRYKIHFQGSQLHLPDQYLELIAFDPKEDLDTTPITYRPLSLRLKMIALLKSFDQQNPMGANLKRVQSALDQHALHPSKLPSDTATAEKEGTNAINHLFQLTTLKNHLIAQGAKVPTLWETIIQIKNSFGATAWYDIPEKDFFQVLQQLRKVGPQAPDAFEGFAQSTASEDRSPLDAEIQQTCERLGGAPLPLQDGDEGAFLCQFGEAGIGAVTLHKLLTEHVIPMAIEAFLHPQSHADLGNPIGLVPVFDPVTGKMSLKPGTIPEVLKNKGVDAVPALSLQVSPELQQSQYCRRSHGHPVLLTSSSTSHPIKACVYDEDGSGIEARTLFEGPDSPKNQELIRVIRTLLPA